MTVTRKRYLLTHHLRDVDRYLHGRGDEPRVYALLRSNRPYVSITAFAKKGGWSEQTQRRIKALMQEVSNPVRFRGHTLPPRIEVGAEMARAYHVDPLFAEWLCEELAAVCGSE